MARVKTQAAFDVYRAQVSLQSVHPDVARYEGDMDAMTPADGLCSWDDGSAPAGTKETAPVLDAAPVGSRLWVVTANDVLHAAENCPFGNARAACAVKHSNLTGGTDAYAGGELVFLDADTLVINGCSGRYRVRSGAEMNALAGAFRASGYKVWSMGWSADTNRPAMFGTQDPEWVAA